MKFSKTHPWILFQKQCSIAYRKNKDKLQFKTKSRRIQPIQVTSKKLKRFKTPKLHATKGLKIFHNTVSSIEKRAKTNKKQRKFKNVTM